MCHIFYNSQLQLCIVGRQQRDHIMRHHILLVCMFAAYPPDWCDDLQDVPSDWILSYLQIRICDWLSVPVVKPSYWTSERLIFWLAVKAVPIYQQIAESSSVQQR